MVPIAIEVLFGVITFGISTVLGILILTRDIQSWTNRLFFLLALTINVYIIVNFLSLHPPQPTPENQLFWIRVVMFVTSFLGPILVLLVHTFPSKNITLKPLYVVLLLLLMTASASASLAPLVFQDIRYSATGTNPIPVSGPGMPIFLLDFVGLFVLSFVILTKKYRSTAGIEKAQNLSMLAGIVSSFSLMAFATVIAVTFFQTSAFVFLGPIFPVILMSFIAYAIATHGLFNLKIFAGQLLIVILWIILFARVFIPSSLIEKTIDISIFVAALIVGILTLKSFQKEINYRAQEAAYKELQRLDEAKSEFITIASHQLRTPLSGLKGYIAMAQEGSYGKLPKDMTRVLGNMGQATERLISLADSFLNVSRMRSGKIDLDKQETDVPDFLETLVQEMRPRAEEKGLTLAWKPPTENMPKVAIDQEKIRTVIEGMIDNAIRYTKKGRIEIKLKVQSSKSKNAMLLSVSDTGKGLTKEECETVFRSFTRGKTAQSLWTEGVGLSL